MKTARARAAMATALCLFACVTLAATDDDDDKAPSEAGAAALATLTSAQAMAVGIVVARVTAQTPPGRSPAFGRVLDAAALVAEAGEAEAAVAASRNISTEAERTRGLYRAGAGTSLKAMQAAEAEQVRARTQQETAAAKFASRWPAVAALATPARRLLCSNVAKGDIVLLRAELPGRNLPGLLPTRALIDIDGIEVPARILGMQPALDGDSINTGLLLAVDRPPPGLGAGARFQVALLADPRKGFVLPRAALLYEAGGIFVYKRLAGAPADPGIHFAPVKVELLQALGDGWLVDGIDDDDDIVLHGAGVLWSLQGIGSLHAGDDDDD